VVEWRERAVAGRRDLRPVPVEALHVTLVFLGYLPEKDIDRVAAATGGAVQVLGAPLLQVCGVRAVPPRNPRLFALDLADEGERCAAVQAAASHALERERLYRPEKRPFWAHITVARVKRGERRSPPLDAPEAPSEPFAAGRLTLYRSHLSPRGARYEALRGFDLKG
jgi:RNA 2',3'-cyclic 3'-phosphodiesterase